ncbi:MAG TPA: hypothetical protein VE219_00190, partial [Candidatus Sulfotelmatobacter sp.]|nr:hypothetical protein [Candidatus Sulfotelmatobacter sp.]
MTQLLDPTKPALPGSRKAYIAGSRPDLRVPVREVVLQGASAADGNGASRVVQLYDTSGPYTDPETAIDVRRGLPKLRA